MSWIVEKREAIKLVMVKGKAGQPQCSLGRSFEIKQSSGFTNSQAFAKKLDRTLQMLDYVTRHNKVELVIREWQVVLVEISALEHKARRCIFNVGVVYSKMLKLG